ncbi:MAG TPA: glycosyl hydrolase family 43, partial [Armatimonadetes bacterium]|nr:glycosyl hydrolase family 43 [Armatimonadota bacterium]
MTGFLWPPKLARPQTWWHWMNGNVTAEGIARDLKEMAWVGLGGAHIFNVSEGIPHGPVKFGSERWLKLVGYAVREAGRLGLELVVHNCAGWSSTGGPWIDPEHAMQMLVWSEVHLRGPRAVDIVLPKPPTKHGFYRDIAVIAFPEVKMTDFSPKVKASAPGFYAPRILDGRLDTEAVLPAPKPEKPQFIEFEFPKPFTARSLTIIPGEGRSDHQGMLQVSEDGRNFRTVRKFSIPRGFMIRPVLTLVFEPVRGRFFRVVFTRACPGARSIRLSEVEISPMLRVENITAKACYLRANRPGLGPFLEAPPECSIPKAKVLDLTDKVVMEGPALRLRWRVPEGSWTVLRLGHTPTGKTNHPAPPEGTGLECDKLSKRGADLHWREHLLEIVKASGPFVGKALKGVLIDSYEVGPQNWTAEFPKEFKERRGYDILPFLPVLTGRVVESLEVSERFLFDFRRTVADLFADNYYGRFAELCRRFGLELYVEPYGNGPFNDLSCGGRADVPMGEFWVRSGWSGSCKLAASIAHTYGKRVVGAEAFTASPPHGAWKNHPYSLKALGDLMFCTGVNRFIFHRFAHQPWPGRRLLPGMTMGPWGFHFEWTQTWWREAPAWIEYLSRCQFLLQQGTFVADICYFVGEDAPNGLHAHPPPPRGYDYDCCDKEVLLKLTVRDGRVVAPGGTSYAILVLPNTDRMSPEVARKVAKLVHEGATVYGPKPRRSPSLEGFPGCDEEVRSVADEVWGNCNGRNVKEHRYGKGRVVWGVPLRELLLSLKVKPDFEFESPSGG